MSQSTQSRAVGSAGMSLPFWQQLRWNLIVLFVLLAILPVTVASLIILERTSRQATEQVFEQLDSVAELKNDQILRWLDEGELAIDILLIGSNFDRFTALAAADAPDPQEQAALTGLLIDVTRAGYFKRVFVYDATGRVIASSDPAQVWQTVGGQPYFDVSLHADYIQSPFAESDTGQLAMYMTRPLRGGRIQASGVLAGQLSIDTLADIMTERTGLGELGETYLVSLENHNLLTPSRFEGYEQARTYHSEGIDRALNGETGRGAYAGYRTPSAPVFGAFRFVPELQAGLLAEVEQAQALAAFQQAQLLGIGVAALATLFAVGLGLISTNRVTRPIGALTVSAQRIGAGDLSAEVVELRRRDEIGVLSRVFRQMQSELRTLYGGLEQRVAERTEQLRASADVGRATASILDPDQLLREVVTLIVDRFGLYYAAVFTLDESRKYAVLREAAGPVDVGRILKKRGHQLEVGGQSMVGYATAQRKPRIVLDVGAEAVRFANPLLPDTRSEIALPLLVGDRVLGALDVQSKRESAFDEAGAAVLQSMADQIAIALNNAVSYAESEAEVKRSSALYAASQEVGRLEADLETTVGTMLRQAGEMLDFNRWQVLVFDAAREALTTLTADSVAGDIPRRLRPADAANNPIVRSAAHGESYLVNDRLTDPRMKNVPADSGVPDKFISVPIAAHGATIGALALGRSPDRPDLTERDLEVGRSLASLAAIAIENRRLFAQTRNALAEVDAVNRRLMGESWSVYTRRLARSSVMWIGGGRDDDAPEVVDALSLGQTAVRSMPEGGRLAVAVPLLLRGMPIGALRLTVRESEWEPELAATLDTLAGHIVQAAENARLIETTEERALRERTLAEAADKIRRRTGVERILQTTAEELAHHLGLSRVAVQLNTAGDDQTGDGHNGHEG